MIMSRQDCFKAALNMIQVTPENYNKLTAQMIGDLCKVIEQAEKELPQEKSAYEENPEAEILTF